MKKQIEELLNSNLSSNKIATLSGVDQPTIHKIRKGQSKLGNITLDKAEKLFKTFKEMETMNKVEQIRAALQNTEESYYIEEYENIQELVEYFKENDDDFDIEDLKEKSSKKFPEIRQDVALVTYDNPNTDLFEWAYLDEEVETIISKLRN